MREYLRAKTKKDWVWRLLSLYECVCGHRERDRNKITSHRLRCRDDRGYNGQG